jgi:hypothetical protein
MPESFADSEDEADGSASARRSVFDIIAGAVLGRTPRR